MQVQEYLNQRKVHFEVLEHPPTYDAQRMAQAVHTPGHQVAKTVLLRAGQDVYFVAVLAADQQIDLQLAGSAIGGRPVELATEKEIGEHCPDCEIGALPPFGSHYGMQTLLEKGLLEDEEIVFEGNTHHEAIRMTLADFRRLEEPLVSSFAQTP